MRLSLSKGFGPQQFSEKMAICENFLIVTIARLTTDHPMGEFAPIMQPDE
jgi:hypothetical protein